MEDILLREVISEVLVDYVRQKAIAIIYLMLLKWAMTFVIDLVSKYSKSTPFGNRKRAYFVARYILAVLFVLSVAVGSYLTKKSENHYGALDLEYIRMLEVEQIKKAYRNASRKAHPDKGGTAEEFSRIAEATEVIGGDNRILYDRMGSLSFAYEKVMQGNMMHYFLYIPYHAMLVTSIISSIISFEYALASLFWKQINILIVLETMTLISIGALLLFDGISKDSPIHLPWDYLSLPPFQVTILLAEIISATNTVLLTLTPVGTIADKKDKKKWCGWITGKHERTDYEILQSIKNMVDGKELKADVTYSICPLRNKISELLRIINIK